MSEHDQIIEQIRAADCFKPAKYTARNFLDVADACGHVRLTYEAALSLSECTTVVTLRTHLIALKSAGVLNYHLNGAVDITFTGFPGREIDESMIAQRSFTRGERSFLIAHRASAPTDPPQSTAIDDDPRAPSDHFRALGDQKRSPSDHENTENDAAHYISACERERALVGWLVGSNNQPETETNQPTNPDPNAGIDPLQAAQTYALLLAIRMKASNAKRFSENIPFVQCRQFVAHWWYNRKCLGGRFADHPGILVRWLDSPDDYPPDREYPLAMLAEIHQSALTADDRQQLAAMQVERGVDDVVDDADGMDEFERRQYWLEVAEKRRWSS